MRHSALASDAGLAPATHGSPTAGCLRLFRLFLVLAPLLLGPWGPGTAAQAQPCLRWVQRTDVGSPGERQHHAMAYDPDRGVVVLFGGAAGNDYLQGTQEYDGTRWRQVSIAGLEPSHRAYHAMAYDAFSNEIILDGGYAGGVYGLGDTWVYRGTAAGGTWTLAAGQVSENGWIGHQLFYDPNRQGVTLVGGATKIFDVGAPFSIFNQAAVLWLGHSWVTLADPASPALYGFGLAYDEQRGVAVLAGGFGGVDETDRTDHVFEFTPTVGWRDLGATLPGRGYPVMAYDSRRKRVVMAGGDGGQGNTVVEYDPARGWVRLPDFPGFGRAGAAMVYDSRRARMVFMGGAGAGATFSDTWELEIVPLNLGFLAPAADVVLCERDPLTLYAQPGDGRPLDYQWLIDNLPVGGATNPVFTVAPFSLRGEHAFQLRATDLCGNVFTSAPIQRFIHAKPTLLTDGGDKFLCPGETFSTFVTAISSLQPVTFQWSFNDSPIPGATNATLVLPNVQHTNTGFYSVRVSNGCGTADSSLRTLHLQVGVTLSTQPTNTVVDVCQPTAFTVSARGVGRLRYQWRLDGAPLLDTDTYQGTTRSNLSVHPCRYDHEGNYDVIVSDDCGPLNAVTSRVVRLTLRPGPEWVLRATNGPSARSEHALAYDAARHVTLLFGGQQPDGNGGVRPLGDLWEWNGARWTHRLSPPATQGWIYSPATGWRLSYDGPPVARLQHALAYDSLRQRTVLFGGQTRAPDGSQVFLRDTWEWDGASWTLKATNGPASRIHAGMAFDRARGVTVLTGGFLQGGTPDPVPAAIWEWDGALWQIKTPSNHPPANYSQDAGGLVYDSFRRLSIFGPVIENEPSARWSFWAWNGLDWSRLTNEFIPQFWGLQYGGMAYDSQRRRTVWFGGEAGSPSDGTGFFDGSHWDVLLNNPTPPAPRSHLALAYDSDRHATVMFGGERAGRNLDGETWELLAVDVPVINAPPASQYRLAGENALFEAAARGPAGALLTYEWYRDGQRIFNSSHYSGATSPTLTVKSVTAADAGIYTVRVTDGCGSSFGAPSLLTLNPDLQLISTVQGLLVIWSQPDVVLQYGDTPGGPWTTIPGATSPYRAGSSEPARFFRLIPAAAMNP